MSDEDAEVFFESLIERARIDNCAIVVCDYSPPDVQMNWKSVVPRVLTRDGASVPDPAIVGKLKDLIDRETALPKPRLRLNSGDRRPKRWPFEYRSPD